MQQNWASSLLLDQPSSCSKYFYPLRLAFFILIIITDSSQTQADDKFWKRKKPRQPTSIPTEQQDEPANADELAAEGEAEVELDSLGRLFIQLADTPSLQDEAEISHTNEPEVTLITSDSNSPIPIW